MMSIYRRAARRDSNERDIIDALEAVGAVIEQLSRPCDLAVFFRGRHYLIEVDNPESKYRKREPEQLETFARMGIPIVQTAHEALVIIGGGYEARSMIHRHGIPWLILACLSAWVVFGMAVYAVVM